MKTKFCFCNDNNVVSSASNIRGFGRRREGGSLVRARTSLVSKEIRSSTRRRERGREIEIPLHPWNSSREFSKQLY